MALSWNEIKERAVAFSKEWAGTSNEEADAKPFLEAFFNVFGITRKRVALFEHRVKKLNATDGYIDLIWKGVILVEMKSLGKNLDRAFIQAKEYTHHLKEHEIPKYVLVADFDTFRLYDTEEDKTVEFHLKDLVKNVQHFGYIAGYQKHSYKEQDPVNIKAAELMGKLHDKLKAVGYKGHPLEVYLVRLLFCLFADDTTIFDKDIFKEYIEFRTADDGSDLAAKLSEIFYILNTPKDNRLKNIDEGLNDFPYVNGKLFEESLPHAAFDSSMRKILIDCCGLNWGTISPAIFGSMFQSVMDPDARRNLGAHYTSEHNILKVIKPLFLDELRKELNSISDSKSRLIEFHKKLSLLKFLDPACGCGNFLVITYRELRLLEIEILRAMNKSGTGFLDVRDIIWLDVDMMIGIEYEEFPARIAEVAMWLIDHQMNMLISEEFGQYFVRLPLKKAANIVHGNALIVRWKKIIANTELSYILGNPPFSGSKKMSQTQRDEIVDLFDNATGSGNLDYVAGWYLKAAEYISGTKIKVGLVSTNSIVQGEQATILWEYLLSKFELKIHFAHRTFKWKNEAKGNAAVFCVIVGFAEYDVSNKFIYDYNDVKGEPHEIKAKNINPYLIDYRTIFIQKRRSPICNVPEISFGNMPNDGGNFLLTDAEKIALLEKEPAASKFVRPILSAHEFLNGEKRWCIWLKDIKPNELRGLKEIEKRVANVKHLREASTREATRKLSLFPQLFGEIRQPSTEFILIPRHSSENRKYIPFGFFNPEYIVSDSCLSISDANLFHLGVLHSEMHMAWVRTVCGRIKSDFRYSNEIVYNNFPWPLNATEKQIANIATLTNRIIEIRSEFDEATLADLYSPLAMPGVLVKAHSELDKTVDLAFRPQPFLNEAKRMEFLFELYEKYTADLFSAGRQSKKTKPKSS
jgi:hypothetical protein